MKVVYSISDRSAQKDSAKRAQSAKMSYLIDQTHLKGDRRLSKHQAMSNVIPSAEKGRTAQSAKNKLSNGKQRWPQPSCLAGEDRSVISASCRSSRCFEPR